MTALTLTMAIQELRKFKRSVRAVCLWAEGAELIFKICLGVLWIGMGARTMCEGYSITRTFLLHICMQTYQHHALRGGDGSPCGFPW